MKRPCKATEQHSLEETLRRLPETEGSVKKIMARLEAVTPLKPGATVLDVGAAQGRWVIALSRMGYEAFGLEPAESARRVAVRLANHVGARISMVAGWAEAMPFASNRFDVVLAESVLEHVTDARITFAEVYRVLKPGGVFWFFTASSVCPRQREIQGFPLFGWYPDRLKRHIMQWAKNHRPHAVGYTQAPAIHWFTPWKARRMLREAGFSRVLDRWDLRRMSEGGRAYRTMLRFIRSGAVTKLLADVVIPSCAYAAVK